MYISDFLSPADALVGINVPDKTPLLQELADRAAISLALPADRIMTELLKREKLGSTGTGGGIAIPHARIAGLNKTFGILVRLQQPINFDAIDDQPVDLVFLLLLPLVPGNEQLTALASVARTLRNSTAVHNLRSAQDSATLYRAMVMNDERHSNGL